RRAFLAMGAAAGAVTLGAGRLLIDTPAALASEALPAGDAAILKFLAAAELLEADLWKQYNELGGVQDGEVAGGSGNRADTQAIANTAAFHFGMIEQGGSSLYAGLAQRATDPEVLRILLSIGPTEVMHFQTWQDKAGNAPALTDPTNGLVFPDLNRGGEDVKP